MRIPELARLCALNFGIQLVWGAILAVSLQVRSIEVAPHDGVRAYALLASVGALIATAVQLGAGRLSDVRRRRSGGRRAFNVLGVGLAAAMLLWFYGAPTFAQLVASFFALQVAMNVVAAPFQAVIADWVAAERRGAASSWMAAYQSLGNTAGLLVAGFVHDARWIALALGATLAATWTTTVAAVRGMVPPPPRTTARFGVPGALGALLVARGITNVGYFTLVGFVVFYANESLSANGAALRAQASLVLLAFVLAAAGGAALAARPADRYDKRRVFAAGNAVTVVALAILVVARAPGLACIAAAVAGVGWGMFVTADWALASGIVPAGASATAMALWNAATTVPQIVAPALAVPLVQRFDAVRPGLGPRAAFVLALVEFALGAALVWRIPRAAAASG